VFFGEKLRMGIGVLRVARGGSGAKAPLLASIQGKKIGLSRLESKNIKKILTKTARSGKNLE